MAIEIPSKGKATLVHHGHELEIRLPIARNIIGLVIIPVWMYFWIQSLVPAIRESVESPAKAWDTGSLLWALVGVIIALFFTFQWLWMLLGREVVSVSARSLRIERKLFGIGRTREYAMDRIQNIRVGKGPVSPFWRSRGTAVRGTIQFDYEDKVVGFGSGIDDAEGQFLINEMKRLGYVRER
jgi:small-conductance mechanosensitive channel